VRHTRIERIGNVRTENPLTRRAWLIDDEPDSRNALSGLAGLDHDRWCSELGFAVQVTKPFDPDIPDRMS
jgi:hypothetical protein